MRLTIANIIASIVLLGACTVTTFCRGQIPPPPGFSGGNVGDWLPRGPLFGFDAPNGPGFDTPLPGIGGSGGNGDFGWDWGRDNEGGGNDSLDYGCPGTCLAPSMTGPCHNICVCGYAADTPANSGQYVDAACQTSRLGITDATCRDVGDNCSGIVVRR